MITFENTKTTRSTASSFMRRARALSFGLAAVGAAFLMLPGNAEAAQRPHEIADKLDRISYQVREIKDIRGLRRQDQKIDRLQSRLHRLERISDRQRGRRARANSKRIDRLQHRLSKMERRIEARLDRRHDRRYSKDRKWHRDYDRRYDYRGYRDGRSGFIIRLH